MYIVEGVMIAVPVPIDVSLRRDEHGVIRVGDTRVTLETVIADFHKGSSAEEIVHHYPVLDLSDVYVIIGYYLQNKDEVETYLRQQRELAEQVRNEFEALYPQDALRAKLIKRLEEKRKAADL
jgi:uncharacterized protein (DUF433 family)